MGDIIFNYIKYIYNCHSYIYNSYSRTIYIYIYITYNPIYMVIYIMYYYILDSNIYITLTKSRTFKQKKIHPTKIKMMNS